MIMDDFILIVAIITVAIIHVYFNRYMRRNNKNLIRMQETISILVDQAIKHKKEIKEIKNIDI